MFKSCTLLERQAVSSNFLKQMFVDMLNKWRIQGTLWNKLSKTQPKKRRDQERKGVKGKN